MKFIAITPGDPAGIGPDIVLQAAKHLQNAPLLAVADLTLLRQRAKRLNVDIHLIPYDTSKNHIPQPGQLAVLNVPLDFPCTPGKPDVRFVGYIIKTLKIATQACLQHRFQALVTGPVNKALISDGGISFSGHTAFLTKYCHVKQTVMMLMTDTLKVALVTTHIPLCKVSSTINIDSLTQCIEIIQHDFSTRFSIKNPRILVCGLNPHAGEYGHLGEEEQTVIIPTLNKLRQRGFNLIGPISADIAFTNKQLTDVDVVLAMYHDQGLPVLKYAGFGEAVNITLGLPFIRTSVDHGTAYDIAGTNQANPNSLIKAIQWARRLSKSQ